MSMTVAAVVGILVSTTAHAQAWLNLEQAMERGRSRAPQVIESEASLRVARTAEIGARLPILGNPHLEILAGQQRLAALEVDSKLYLPWEISGQRTARIGEAERLVSWRRLADSEARARAVGEVVGAWGIVVTASARVEQAARAEQEARKEAQWVHARYQSGAATLIEDNFAQAETSRWAQARAEAEVLQHYARGRLAVLTSMPMLGLPPSPQDASVPRVRFRQAGSESGADSSSVPGRSRILVGGDGACNQRAQSTCQFDFIGWTR